MFMQLFTEDETQLLKKIPIIKISKFYLKKILCNFQKIVIFMIMFTVCTNTRNQSYFPQAICSML